MLMQQLRLKQLNQEDFKMQDWVAIIKEAARQELITPEEEKSLLGYHGELTKVGFSVKKKISLGKRLVKTFSPKDIKMRYGKGNFWKKTIPGKTLKWTAQNPTTLVALAMGAELGSLVTKAVAAPIKSRVNYTSMKEELKRISPETVAKNDDSHIRKIYGSVTQLAPAIASNPTVTAVLVRDNIDMPHEQHYSGIQALSQIQKNIADQKSTSGGSTIIRSITAPAISETTKAVAKQLVGK